jgi:hypothetical protein
MNEIACPNIVLESRRLPGATVARDAGLGTEFSRLSPPDRPLQAQLEPEPMDSLEVHRPSLAIEHHVDSTVTETGMSSGQSFDLPDQGRVVGSAFPIVPQGRS